jgi:hypothetical protein
MQNKTKYTLGQLLLAIALMAAALGVFVSTPDKYNYGQEMIVTSGFYKGQTGTISERHWFGRYTVSLNDAGSHKVKESSLRPRFNLTGLLCPNCSGPVVKLNEIPFAGGKYSVCVRGLWQCQECRKEFQEAPNGNQEPTEP